MEKKLLLHACCAPCSVYVVEELQKRYRVTLFFCNPNIQPQDEYESRRSELEKISLRKGWQTVFADYRPEQWLTAVKGLEKEPEKSKRCSVCFYLRLKEAFAYAADNGYDVVASTLSISPYKVTAQINREGEKLGREYGIEFLGENFKKKDGYNKGRKMARELGIVFQDYCGCIFSKREKIEKRESRELINRGI